MARIKTENRDARHNVYAWSLSDGTRRYSDDGEPSGTGGAPIMAVLDGMELADICVVVTRYFGGVLLGEGGLVRAYSGSVKLALENAELVKRIKLLRVETVCPFDLYSRIASVLSSFPGARPLTPEFTDSVRVPCLIEPGSFDSLSRKIRDLSAGRCECRSLGTEFTEVK